MTVVAIHQPNYFPWLGYFSKINQADVFIFLDDAQYTKNSFINRVRVLCEQTSKWLTIPVKVPIGTRINCSVPSSADWSARHLDLLAAYYRKAPARGEVLDELSSIYEQVKSAVNLADINVALIRAIAVRLGLSTVFRRSSEIGFSGKFSDDRLVELVKAVDAKGIYLSGQGADSYQDAAKFRSAGIEFAYTSFVHPRYEQGTSDFVPGLSIIDAVFWNGWEGTAAMLRN